MFTFAKAIVLFYFVAIGVDLISRSVSYSDKKKRSFQKLIDDTIYEYQSKTAEKKKKKVEKTSYKKSYATSEGDFSSYYTPPSFSFKKKSSREELDEEEDLVPPPNYDGTTIKELESQLTPDDADIVGGEEYDYIFNAPPEVDKSDIYSLIDDLM